MEYKKFLLPLMVLVLGFSLASCNDSKKGPDSVDPNKPLDVELVKKEIKINNQSKEFTLSDDKLTTYFLPNGSVPFVGVKEFITSLDGYFKSELIQIDLNNKEQVGTYTNQGEYLKFDCKNDKIYLSGNNFFYFINQPEGIDYNNHMRYTDTYYTEPSSIEYDLRPYSFDAQIYEGDVIVPFNILTSLFLGNNIATMIYNQKEYFFFGTYIEDPAEMKVTRNKEIEGKMAPDDLALHRYNELLFILDNFYGLKQPKGITSFKNYIEYYFQIDRRLKSSNPYEFELGLKALINKNLDDPHSSVGFKSIYSKITGESPEELYIPFDFYDVGPRYQKVVEVDYDLSNKYNKSLGNYKVVRFRGDTAFIKFDHFMVGYDEEIYNEDGSLKPNAYEYDTYYLFQYAFNEIYKKENIKNVVIDLSNNKGGTLAAAINAIGFLGGGKSFIPAIDYSSNYNSIEYYDVDVNDDGLFDEKDNIFKDKYNFYVLTSETTFSAANLFTSVCKDFGLATIIGKQSSGGSCGVMPTNLIDGTTFSLSGTFALAGVTKNGKEFDFHSIEYGIPVDHEISYDFFYDLSYIDHLIKNNFK